MNTKNIIRKVLKEYSERRNLRLYGLDWDDNILNMPTNIYLKDDEDNVIGMPTNHFAEYRHLVGKEPFDYEGSRIVGFDNDAFRDFTHPETFIRDTIQALKTNRFSPSFDKFKETLMYANPFSIITARGHNPEVIKKGVKYFISLVLDNSEKKIMIDNIKDVLNFEELSGYYKIDDLDFNQLIDIYLDEKGEYYPVSSKEFGLRFNLDPNKGASSPEQSKKLALYDFIKQVYQKVGKLIKSGKYESVSVGFSDDDVKNVESMVDYIENELSKIYPEIHFVVKLTSEGNTKKIVITRVK